MNKESIWRRKSNDFIESKLGECKYGKILDIGCGKKKWKSGQNHTVVIGVDNQNHEGVDFVCDVNQKLPFESKSFDFALMNNFLEHTLEPKEVLQHTHRVLKDEGTLLITVPFLVKVHQAPVDFYRYTPFAITQLLVQSGFRVEEVESLTNIQDTFRLHAKTFLKIAMRETPSRWRRYFLYRIVNLIMSLLCLTFRISSGTNSFSTIYTLGFGIRCKKMG